MVQIRFSFVDARGASLSNVAALSDTGDPNKPVVVLLHGLGGSSFDWSTPTRFGMHYDTSAPFPPSRNLGFFPYPAAGLWRYAGLDPLLPSLTSWVDFLNGNGFRTVNYTQVDRAGVLARPVLELSALMGTLTTAPAMSETRFILLAHSRGGLLARKFLKDNRNDTALVGRITKVITLHSPHQGSAWGNNVTDTRDTLVALSALVDSTISVAAPGAGSLTAAAVAPLVARMSRPAYREMRVGGPFISALQDGETALPGVEYHTFGGTSVTISRVRGWFYTAGSALPAPRAGAPFNHVVTMGEVPGASPVLESVPPANDEMTPGLGDILVADARSRLPFATHHGNPLNHAQVLWDPGLQAQVLDIIRDGGTWTGWTIHRGPSLVRPPLVVADEHNRLALFTGTSSAVYRRRELAAGDTVPIGTPSPVAGEAAGWTDWGMEELAGRHGLAAAFDLLGRVGSAPPNGRLHLFAMGAPSDDPGSPGGPTRRPRNNIWARWRVTNPDDWSDWNDLGGTKYGPSDLIRDLVVVQSTLESGLAAIRNREGEIELFANGSDGTLWTAREIPPVTIAAWPKWTSWSSLGLESGGGTCTPATDADGALLLFVVSAQGVVRCYRRAGHDEPWAEWEFPSEAVQGRLVVVPDTEGKLVVLGRGQDGAMRWAREKDPLQVLSAVGSGVAVLEGSRASGRASTTLRRANGSVGVVRVSGRWSPWMEEPGILTSGLSAAANVDGSIEVFARGSGGELLRQRQDVPRGDWSGWTSLGGSISQTPAAATLADGRMMVCALSAEGHLRQRAQTFPGTWV